MVGLANVTPLARRVAPLLAGGIAIITATGLTAQVVEEHPATILQGQQVASLNAGLFASRPDDPTPFGVDLSGLLLVDAQTNGGKIRSHDGSGGIDTTFGGPTAQNAALRNLLAKYVGRPLSFQLLSKIQTDITQFYRDNGRSLVSVTVPQQEITGGVVQINVTAFRLATTNFEGADPTTLGFLTRQVRMRPGQEVDTDQLLDDVNWLNQNPFRHVSVVFEPGASEGSTDLTLQVRTGRTWSGYAGLSNTGSEDTGLLRVYAGANMSALAWKDQQLSYQFTGSPESLGQLRLWDTGADKGYLSHALSYFIPITTESGFRTKLTFGASHISSYSVPGGAFTSGTETVVLNGEMSIPLPRTQGRFALVPEVYAQVEMNQYDKVQYFGGLPFATEDTRLLHGAIGLRTGMNGPMFGKQTRGSADLAFVFGQRDTDGFPESDYAFTKLTLKQEIFLARDRSLAWRFSGQSSNDDLHSLEQMALGGDSTVRGYPINGVAANNAYAASVEYRMPPIAFRAGKEDGKVTPHVFFDFGFAGPGTSPVRAAGHLASVGFGGNFEVGGNLVGTIDIAHTLKSSRPTGAGSTSSATPAGTTSVAFQFTARF